MLTYNTSAQLYLDVPVRQKQVDDDIDWKALHVVQPLLDSAQLGSQLRAGVKLPSFADLIQNRLTEILTETQKTCRDKLLKSILHSNTY